MTPDLSPLQKAECELRELRAEEARLRALIARLRPWDVSEADWAAAVAAGLADSPLTTP